MWGENISKGGGITAGFRVEVGLNSGSRFDQSCWWELSRICIGWKAQIEKFDRTAHRKKEQKKIDRPRQSTRIWLERATAAAFPDSPQPGCGLKLSPPRTSPRSHNSSKLIVARVSPFKSKEGIATVLTGEDVLNWDETIVFLVEGQKHKKAASSGCLGHKRAECYKISNSSRVRKLRSNAKQQPNSIGSKPLITYNLNQMPQALLPRASS